MACRVLVIEDDGAIADVLRMKLAREGHEVTIATSQRATYHTLDQARFDFALLDLRLPTDESDMDPNSEVGFAILAHIRGRFTAQQLPVIVMTAYEDTSQTAVRALRAGANDYITKPFEDSPVSLDEKLRQVIVYLQQAKPASTGAKDLGNRKPHRIVLSAGRVELDGVVLQGRSADLILLLGKRTLMVAFEGAGDGDPRMPGKEIAVALGIQEPSVRQHVTRLRRRLAAEYKQRNLGSIDDQAIVSNERDWKGYYINRETCEVSGG